MSQYLKICETCKKNKIDDGISFSPGYIHYLNDDVEECLENHPLNTTNMSIDDFIILTKISNSTDFYDAMIELHDKDIIEYELKMSQFRAQVNVQNEIKQQSNQQSNQPKCPTCRSTNIRKIGTGERVASVVGFGIFSKKINKTWKCKNCGHTW